MEKTNILNWGERKDTFLENKINSLKKSLIKNNKNECLLTRNNNESELGVIRFLLKFRCPGKMGEPGHIQCQVNCYLQYFIS